MSTKNPVVNGWYADPESRVYGDTVYMYVTKSLPFEEQKNLDLVTTKDLEHFTVHHDILKMETFKGASFAIWAPTVIEKSGKYYLIFAANNIYSEEEVGGLYIGAADVPEGPFANVFADGRPLLNAIYNHAQPIDAHLFKDDDGAVYLYYGGWRHMMVCRMNETMDGFLPMEEPCHGGVAKEITPKDYVEAPYVMKIDGKYHLMYSSGSWGDGTYCVKAGVAEGPCGEFDYYGDVLKASDIADGPGHNSAFVFKGKHYVAYHRRTIGDLNCHHRRLCIDKLEISDGRLQPVTMTNEWYRKEKKMIDKFPSEARGIMAERFGHDCLIALATVDGAVPFVRTVNSYYENGCFYVITYALSNKMKQIAKNPTVAVCGDWFTAHGVGENLGHILKPENARLAETLRSAFASWYQNGHTNEADPNTCILRIRLTDGVLLSHGTKYTIDFTTE